MDSELAESEFVPPFVVGSDLSMELIGEIRQWHDLVSESDVAQSPLILPRSSSTDLRGRVDDDNAVVLDGVVRHPLTIRKSHVVRS